MLNSGASDVSIIELGSAFTADNAGLWYVLHTKSRQEKALAEELDRMHIPFYLPIIEQVRYHGKRKATVTEPLFAGYVFLRGSLDEAYLADRTKRVANILPVHDQQTLDIELRNLALALHQQAPLDPYPYLKKGRRVQVRAGPFRGLQGLVEERLGWTRLVLGVSMLGQAVSLEIDGSLLDLVD
jgi:transcription antitermination factor NusG